MNYVCVNAARFRYSQYVLVLVCGLLLPVANFALCVRWAECVPFGGE